jgi:hypothetical protein
MTSTANMLPKATHVSDLTEEGWARKIKGAWQKSVDAIFEAGDLLREAKKKLGHGKFEKMVSAMLPFSMRKAQRLMAISRCTHLKENRDRLPPCWGTLDVLASLDKATFDQALKDGAIKPDMERSDAEKLIPQESKLRPRAAAAEADAALREYEPRHVRAVLSDLAGIAGAVDPSKVLRQCSTVQREILREQAVVISEWLGRITQTDDPPGEP